MFESLHPLSDSQIVSGTKKACAQEHSGMLSLLGFLIETERRKIHLKLGYSSMFKYCIQALRHSESEAMLRITAARCVMSFPEIYPLLEAREVNLSTVSRISKVLNRDNCSGVLERIRGKSMREVEAIAAEYDPTTVLPKERIRTVVVRVPVSQAPVVQQSLAPERVDHLCNSGKISSTIDASTSQDINSPETGAAKEAAQLQLERRSVVTIPADDEFMLMLARIRELASHQLRSGMGIQDVLKIAMRYYIKQRDPRARTERRNERAQKRETLPKAKSTDPRHIPAAVRDAVHVRDQRCTYVGPDGRRCDSPHALQVDHINPVTRQGAAVIGNLRLPCAEHNRLEAERLMGKRYRDAPGTAP